MTEIPPYWTQPDINEFKVSINSVKRLDDCYYININEDVIRPRGGGQAGEKGSLTVGDKTVEISDTIGNSEGIVLVTSHPVSEGVSGHLMIDMDWRLAIMKNHTAEHIFAAMIKKQIRDVEVGELWIDGTQGSVELMGVGLEPGIIFRAEQDVNESISQDIPVKSNLVNSDKIDQSIRSREGLTEKHEKLRIVRIGELDSSACSGIHVTRTSKIEFFKVVDFKIESKSSHVEFVTGMKAARLVLRLYNTVLQRKYTYPFEMEQVGAVLDKAKNVLDDKQQLVEKIIQLIVGKPTTERIGNITFKHEYLPGFDANSLRVLSNQLSSSQPSVILLFAPGSKSQVILRSNKMSQEAAHFISDSVNNLGGKGGGKGDIFTGGFLNVTDSKKLYMDLVLLVKKSIASS
jgi:alanyl-tRNA synthetase